MATFGGQVVEGHPNGLIRAIYYDGSIYEGQATRSGPHGWGRKIFAVRKVPKEMRNKQIVCNCENKEFTKDYDPTKKKQDSTEEAERNTNLGDKIGKKINEMKKAKGKNVMFES